MCVQVFFFVRSVCSGVDMLCVRCVCRSWKACGCHIHTYILTYEYAYKHTQVMEEVEGKEGTSIMDAVLEKLVKVVVSLFS